MGSEILSDIASTVLSKTLDMATARQRAIANNIANAETPGYKRSSVSFESELRAILEEPRRADIRRRLSTLEPRNGIDAMSPAKPDGNNVNIDAEIADLASITLKHKAATVLLESKIAMLRAAISEGKR